MIKKTIHLISILFFCTSVFAQNTVTADKRLAELLNTIKNTPSKADFKILITDKSNQGQSVTGNITLKNTKYFIEMKDMKIWYDGHTQWAYVVPSNEVSVTEPTEKEIAENNPIAILSRFKEKSVTHYSKKQSVADYVLEMIPKVKSSDISKIEIQINKTTNNLTTIKLSAKNGNITVLTLANYQKGLKIGDAFFIFQPSKYKNVVENDLR